MVSRTDTMLHIFNSCPVLLVNVWTIHIVVVTTGYQDEIAGSFNQNSLISFKYILKNCIFEPFNAQR